MTRGVDDLLADLAEAADAAAEVVMLGKEWWDAEHPLRLVGEAIIGRLGDIAIKLPDEVTKATPEVPWREVKGMRSSPRTPITASLRGRLGHLARRRAADGRGDRALASDSRLSARSGPGEQSTRCGRRQ